MRLRTGLSLGFGASELRPSQAVLGFQTPKSLFCFRGSEPDSLDGFWGSQRETKGCVWGAQNSDSELKTRDSILHFGL